MHEREKKPKRHTLRGTAVLLAALLLFPIVSGRAAAVKDGPRMLVPVGRTVGIKLFARGVLVVGLTDGSSPAKSCGLEKGDVILKCNGAAVTSTEQFQSMLQSAKGDAVDLQVGREDEQKSLTVRPQQAETGNWAIGAWIRDSMAGIGTLTYYDPDTAVFGALGHGVTDTDTAQLMPFSSGSILPSSVKAVKRGEAGAAGELRGDFDLTTDLGSLTANTEQGVFGKLDQEEYASGEALPAADPAEVHDGPAVIRSNVDGCSVRDYAVEIRKLSPAAGDCRELLVTVTDPDLLASTGGIVQGMLVRYNRDNTGKP